MTTKTIDSRSIGSIVMIGAGLCAALLFTVAQQRTFMAVVLGCMTPLPIMISTLGFGPAIGLGSAGVAALTVAVLATISLGAVSAATVVAGLIGGIVFAVIQALPAWWLGFISSLARLEDTDGWRIQPADKKPIQLLTFYPIGNILLHAAAITIGLVGLGGGAVVLRFGSFEAAHDRLVTKLSPLVQKLVETHPELSGGLDVNTLTQISLKTMPAVAAAFCLLIFLANLWLAGRVVLTSNKLPRPWPDLAHEVRIPRLAVLALVTAFALSLAKGWPGTAGLVMAVTLGLIFALQGLAVIHDLSRGWRWRLPMLFALYVATALFAFPLLLAVFVLIGLADTALNFRDRKAALLSASSKS
jgi:hypothetical protein